MYNMKLYTYFVGSKPNSERPVINLRRFLEEELGGQYSLEIINLYDNPELADREDIFATSTVIKSFPIPTRRVIGNLSYKEKIYTGLDLADFHRRPKACKVKIRLKSNL